MAIKFAVRTIQTVTRISGENDIRSPPVSGVVLAGVLIPD